jgi:uncharacterized protein GlcG (DUF336 family)
MKFSRKISSLAVASVMVMASSNVSANACSVSFADFQDAVYEAYLATNDLGFGLPMWATLMDVTGKVCYVTSVFFGGENSGFNAGNKAWLGSRVISAQKANTANAFSLNGLSIPTGAISAAVYPGGSLYGLQHSNPVDATVAYAGNRSGYGSSTDPLMGKVPGGVNVFGGGIALYDSGTGRKIGAIGVSGDTSCRDAAMAYNLRFQLGHDNPPAVDTLALVDTPSDLYQQPLCLPTDASVFPSSSAEAESSNIGVYVP